MRRMTTVFALTASLSLAMSGIALATAEVTITDDGFDPASVEADIREDIVWTNASDKDVSLVGKDPAWTSGTLQPGATFSIKITEKGTYEYASEDGSLEGEIVVGGGAAGGTGEQEADEGGKDKQDEDVKEQDEGNETGRGDGGGRDDDVAAPLPKTGIDVTVPGALSLLLIALGAGLVLATRPTRRLEV